MSARSIRVKLQELLQIRTIFICSPAKHLDFDHGHTKQMFHACIIIALQSQRARPIEQQGLADAVVRWVGQQ